MNLPWLNPARVAALEAALASRILILDGAMGTMIQQHRLEEADYRGTRFAHGLDAMQSQPPCGHAGHGHGEGCGCDLKGNNDLLTLTRPDIIAGIHRAYLEAGADIIETNTFNSTTLSQADYRLQHRPAEHNLDGARLARRACDQVEASDPGRPRFVAGILGPTSRTASISPDVNNPGFRATGFGELATAYEQAALGLIDGGADILMIETVFDTLNAKAAVFAVEEAFGKRGGRLPVMISGTITDRSGRTLSGQTAEAFWYSLAHARPHAVGLNCALGAKDLHAHIDILSASAPTRISCHPNAGLPNAFGEYDESPEQMALTLRGFAEAGLLNIVGGCCGTTPGHIAAIADGMRGLPPRTPPAAGTGETP